MVGVRSKDGKRVLEIHRPWASGCNPERAVMRRERSSSGTVHEAARRLRLLERANEIGRFDLVLLASSGCGPASTDERITSSWDKLESLLANPPPPRPRAMMGLRSAGSEEHREREGSVPAES